MQQVQYIKIGNIISNPNNPRTLKDARFEKLVQSLVDFPEMLEKRPLICVTTASGKFMVLGGNQRLKAATKAGIKQLPVMLADEWSEEKRKEFIVKDNIGFGDWDWDVLANEWDEGKLIEWGLELPEDAQPFEGESEIDYSILDGDYGDIDGDIQAMQNGVKKAIQIEFEAEHYEQAFELVKFWRGQKLYIGGFLMEKLKDEKDKL